LAEGDPAVPTSASKTGPVSRLWARLRAVPLPVTVLVSLAAGFLLGRAVPDGADLSPPSIDLGGPGRYVALGDSYSAGEGLAPFEDGTQNVDRGGDRCHRSLNAAYAGLLAFDHDTTLVFRACSGAQVRHVFDEVQDQSGVPNRLGLQVEPDVADLADDEDDVRLVTITMGGNDVGFADVLKFCGWDEWLHACVDRPFRDHDSLDEWAAVELGLLRTGLLGLYPGLRAAFPTARILVLGYPLLLPSQKAPDLGLRCRILFRAIDDREREAIRGWNEELNRTIQAATEEVGVAIEYVDVATHFAGHEACGPHGEWIQAIGLEALPKGPVRDGLFHPVTVGQQMLARIIACHLAVYSSAEDPRTKGTNYAMTACVARTTAGVTEL
jgi:hypothetical protein